MKRLFRISMFLTMALVALSCERVVFNEMTDGQQESDEDGVQVTLRVNRLEGSLSMNATAETRAVVDVADLCSRLNFVVYQDGEKVKGINQSVSDDDFGTVSLTLAKGTYQLLVLAHSGKSNPTLSDPTKIAFTNTGTYYSDTFYYYGELEVGDDEGQIHNLSLERAVSMFRLVITDEKPANIQKIRIYYTGGSGTLNAVTGFGCVDSKQYVMYDVSEMTSPIELEAYTFLHDAEGSLFINVTAYSNEGVEQERAFEAVPMKRNYITQYSGPFFTGSNPDTPVVPDNPDNPDNPGGGGGEADGQLSVKLDADWGGQSDYTF